MKVSKKEDFTLLFMSVLAKNYSKKYIPISYIAKRHNLSPLFLKHIASDLKNRSLVASKEGIGGGYRLTKSPNSISVSQIIDAVSNRIISLPCTDGKCQVGKKKCRCFSFWNKVGTKLNSYLDKLSLFEFAGL